MFNTFHSVNNFHIYMVFIRYKYGGIYFHIVLCKAPVHFMIWYHLTLCRTIHDVESCIYISYSCCRVRLIWSLNQKVEFPDVIPLNLFIIIDTVAGWCERILFWEFIANLKVFKRVLCCKVEFH